MYFQLKISLDVVYNLLFLYKVELDKWQTDFKMSSPQKNKGLKIVKEEARQ